MSYALDRACAEGLPRPVRAVVDNVTFRLEQALDGPRKPYLVLYQKDVHEPI